MKKNRLIAILMAAAIVLTYMPAMAYGGSEQPAPDADETIALDAENETTDPPEAEENEDSEEPVYEPDEATEDTAAPDADAEETQSIPDQDEETAETAEEPDGEKTLSAFASTEWKKTGSGTVYYAEFPSGYYTSSPLYQKYNRSRVTSYENASNKRVVSTSRVSWIYWHWTWNASVSTGNNNKLIDDKPGYDGQHDYQFFTDFESADSYNVWSGDSRVYEFWRNRPEDGSKWWFRIPVYKQTYTDYKKVTVDPDVPSCNKPSVRITSGTITWNEVYGADGYQIQYSTSPQFKNSKKVIIKGGSNCRYKLTGLKPGTVYYIRIRVYVVVNGKAVYKKWGSTCKIKTCTKAGNLTSIKWSGVKSCTYTGKPLKRSFTIVRNGVTLVEGRDYTVTYKNNTRVGTATIIVKGCGKYFGTITRTFRILPGKTTMSKCTGKSKAVTVRWSCRSRNCSGYQVRYCTRSDFKNCKYKTVKGRNTGSCTISGLKPFTKYYIEVRIYYVVGGRNYYSAWSECSSVSTKADGYRILPVAYTIEYPSYDGDYFDGIKSADIELTYNKYGLVDKMIVYVNSVGGRYKEVKQFKYTFYDNKSVRTLTLPYRTISMNRNGAITKSTRGGWGSYKGKATYYSGTDKLRSMEFSSTEFNHRRRCYFDKAGYMTGYTSNNNTISRTINSKGLCTSVVYKSEVVNIYEYTFKNGKVAARKDYHSNNSGGYIYDKTITVKKWKKVKTYDKSRRSARCITAFLDMVRDEGDKDLSYPSFVYEWK